MKEAIKAHLTLDTPEQGEVGVRFVIHRDGTLTEQSVEFPCPIEVLNDAARRGIRASTVPVLPPEFKDATLTVHLKIVFGIKHTP
jgi:TonB family protein